jgi:hypothetical protein
MNGATLMLKTEGEMVLFIIVAALIRALPAVMPIGTISVLLKLGEGVGPTPPPFNMLAVTLNGPWWGR